MNAKWSKCLLLGCLLSSHLLIQSTAFAANGGAIAGGGGDASEARVNEIRADILSWINLGGAKGLSLQNLDYNEYSTGMKDILTAKKVVIGFVNKDHETDNDLKVNIEGFPKTCRGFIAKDNGPRILCNIARFEATAEADQYSLIHHEYAGLAGFELNDGASSDYHISKQLTGFLTKQTVLRLAIKKLNSQDFELPTIELRKTKYIGNKNFKVTLELKNTKDVLQVILENETSTVPTEACLADVPSLNFINGEISKTFTLKSKCNMGNAQFRYKKMTVQFIDGSVRNLGSFQFNYGLNLRSTSSNVKSEALVLKEEVGESRKSFYGGTELKVFHVTFQTLYKTTKEEMANYEGVIFYDGGTYENGIFIANQKEILSNDPQVLADAVNNHNEVREVDLVQTYNAKEVCKISLFKGNNCTYKAWPLNAYEIFWTPMGYASGVVFIKKSDKGETDVQSFKAVGKGVSSGMDFLSL